MRTILAPVNECTQTAYTDYAHETLIDHKLQTLDSCLCVGLCVNQVIWLPVMFEHPNHHLAELAYFLHSFSQTALDDKPQTVSNVVQKVALGFSSKEHLLQPRVCICKTQSRSRYLMSVKSIVQVDSGPYNLVLHFQVFGWYESSKLGVIGSSAVENVLPNRNFP